VSISDHNRPVAESVQAASLNLGTPEVTGLNYDLWTLRVTLMFEGRDGPIYADFDGVEGFRVLDEGDLCEFWAPEVRVDGWLWQVHRGGWFDLERTRPGFLSGERALLEFLVLGENDCVSILAHDAPTIRSHDSDD
jgi:hypothetical protein